MKNILLLVHDDAGQEARLQAALDIGRAVNGHITCLDVTILPAMLATEYACDAAFGLDMLLAEERDREKSNRTRLEHRLAKEDVAWNWLEATGEIVACLKNASTLADLIVVNRQLDDFPLPDMRTTAGDLVVGSGKPILAVPDSLKRVELDAALVAWDGSPQSAAALRAATPLLKLAAQVEILEIDDSSVRSPAEDAATYLSRHDVPSTIRRLSRGGRTTADILLDRAAEGGFGYVVMGGFGHRRFMEALFGGVTRTMLTRSPIPLFIAH